MDPTTIESWTRPRMDGGVLVRIAPVDPAKPDGDWRAEEFTNGRWIPGGTVASVLKAGPASPETLRALGLESPITTPTPP